MKLPTMRILGTIGVSLALIAAPRGASAAPGDSLASFDASVTAGIPACSGGVGTGIAYDGTNLLLSCWDNNVLQRVNASTHTNAGAVTITGLPDTGLGALAWDATRNRLWACNLEDQIVLIDVGAGARDNSQAAIAVNGCVDGLAYDASDDTLWASADVSSSTCHYQTDGTLITCFDNSGLIGSCGNSGIAVGGADLYLANNGCSEIYQVDKTFTSSSLFAGFPARLEDLECDGRTFSPNGAIWSIDAYDRTVNAWEIPPGQCAFGGLGACGDGTVDPGEQCDDGNLVNGDGCDANCQSEEPAECGNGVLEGGEECDPPGSITCPAGSPAGAFLPCNPDCTCPSECVPTPEVCNNMTDDDCDGLIDCDDTADCPAPCPPILHDPSTIKFGPSGEGRDVFKSHGRVEPGASLDVTSDVVGWVVSNARGIVYRGVLHPEDWTTNAAGTVYRYVDKAARQGHGQGARDGIAKAKIRITRGGTSYGYKVLAFGDLSAATDPNMTIQFYLGAPARAYSHSEPWKRTSSGWKATGFLLE